VEVTGVPSEDLRAPRRGLLLAQGDDGIDADRAAEGTDRLDSAHDSQRTPWGF
jgi:hypothetical protein